MKRNKTLSAAAIAALALGAGACDDGLADLNNNPNAPADVPAPVVLPEAIQSTVELFNGTTFNLEFAGIFSQHWAKIQYVEEDQFILRPQRIDAWWTTLYAASLADWQLIIDKGQNEEPARPNYEATGRVMKAYTGHVMTDVWGDIPWSEALQGAAEDPVTTPTYDSQEAVYHALVAELDAAIAVFDAASTKFGSEDLIYQGNVDAWARFANSLKLRLAIRISGREPGQASAWIDEVLGSPAGLILENSQNAALAYLESPPNQNPLYENFVPQNRDDHAASKTLVDLMGSLNDPRLPIYAEPAANDSLEMGGYVVYNGEVYRGMPNGVPEDDVPSLNTISRIGEHWRSHTNSLAASTPSYLLTASEVHFLLAEAVERGLTTAAPMSAAAYYEQGVTLALQMYDGANGIEITQADIAAYLAQPGVAYGTGDSNLEQIIEQKWLALYTNGPEAYAEYRRTGYPDEVTIRSGHTLDHVPGRIPYPDVEQSLNKSNWEAAKANQGNEGSYQGTVWWDLGTTGTID